jgi:transcriptional regulator with XRE-family HTH domain
MNRHRAVGDARAVGERISYHRKRIGLSQVEFAGLIGRSESWVSQVERGVRSVDRMSVLQKLADALGVSMAELRDGDNEITSEDERPAAFEALRLTLTGHPAIASVLDARHRRAIPQSHLDRLRELHATVWPMVHASRYTELAPVLAELIPELEWIVRVTDGTEVIPPARELLSDTYQATAAMMAKLSETDAAWIAADRAAFVAETMHQPLAVAASLFRMAHVFLTLGQIVQAQTIALKTVTELDHHIKQEQVDSLEPLTEAQSLAGAFYLVLAIAAARDNYRSEAYRHLDQAREIANRIGEDRDDFGTEFGPTNVAIHAVGVAVELGDAGQAIDLAQGIDPRQLSSERQARYLLDLAQAHAMRRQMGEALHCLEEAERLTPEQTRTHRVARTVARDLIQLSGSRPRPELRELAERFGVL